MMPASPTPARAGTPLRTLTDPAPKPGSGASPRFAPRQDAAWALLGGLGLLLLVVGLGDIALAWYPMRPGNPDWELGAIHQTMSILPVPTLGLAALLTSGLALGKRWLVRGSAACLLLLTLILVALDILFVTLIPLALGSVPASVLPGIQKLVARTLFAGTAFPIAYLVAAVAAWRVSRLRTVDG